MVLENKSWSPTSAVKFHILTPKHLKDKLAFWRRTINWTCEDWKQVVFSDESPFELFHTPPPPLHPIPKMMLIGPSVNYLTNLQNIFLIR